MTQSSRESVGRNPTGSGDMHIGDVARAAAQLDQALKREPDAGSRLRLVDPLYRLLMEASDAEREAAIEALLDTRTVLQQLVLKALLAGKLTEARKWCDQLVARDAGDFQSLLLKSIAQEFQQDYPGALSTSDQLVRLRPHDPTARLRRARVLFAGGTVDAFPGGANDAYRRAVEDLDAVIQLDPTSTQAYLNRAQAWVRLGEPDRALADYTAALGLDRTLVDAYRERARIRKARGELELALADFDALTQLVPNEPTGWSDRGDVHLALKDLDAAIRAYDRAIELNPHAVKAFTGRAQAYAALGDLQRSLRDYEVVVQEDPDDLSAHGQRGDLNAALGDRLRDEHPERAVQAYQQAIRDYDAVIQLAPERTEGYLNRARVWVKLDESARALADYTAALAQDRTLADAYRERALIREARQEFKLALADFDAVAQLVPYDARSYLGRGNALIALGDNFGALASYDQVLAVAKGDAPADVSAAYRGRGVANLGIGDGHRARRAWGQMWAAYEAAVADCERARELAPDDVLTCQYLGRGLRSLGAYDEAVEVLQQALRQVDRGQVTLAVTLWGELGQTLRLWGIDLHLPKKIQEAIDALDHALALDTNAKARAWTLDVKASAVLRLDQFDLGLVLFEEAIAQDPSYAWPYVGRGKALFLLGRFEAAMETSDQILRLGPGYEDFAPWGHVGRGLALLRTGKEGEGTSALDDALPDPRTTTGYLNRAEMCRAFRAVPETMSDRQQAVRMAPDSAEALNALAWMIVDEMGEDASELDLGRAAQLAKRSVELAAGSPSQANYLDTLGWAKFRLGHYREALALLEQSSRLRPRHLLSRVHRERAEEALREAPG